MEQSINPHAYCRLRFDEAAEEAIENLANVLQWHRNSAHEGLFVAQKDARAGTSRAKREFFFFEQSNSFFMHLSLSVCVCVCVLSANARRRASLFSLSLSSRSRRAFSRTILRVFETKD
jgi:hypothetical protein